MKVKSIRLSGFRNYDDAVIEFAPGINVISGANAQGKTNLVEAVYMLTCGRSFRTRYDRELIGFDRDYAQIKASIFSGQRDQSIEILLQRGRKKQITQNGSKKKASELSKTLTAVLFCPDDLNIIKDGPAARRRMMDMAISQLRPGYASLISEYSRLYDHKSSILREWRKKPSLLDTIDDFSSSMCRCSAQIIRYRASFVKRLSIFASSIHREFSGAGEELSLSYRTVSTVTDPLAPLEEVYEQVCLHQSAHRQAEIDSQSCLTGTHKDDIDISVSGRQARSFASQGQTRTAALSLKLAEREIHIAESGEYPILLLDDVLSELDGTRQEFVLNRICSGQTLITCCEDGAISGKTGGKVITINAGRPA